MSEQLSLFDIAPEPQEIVFSLMPTAYELCRLKPRHTARSRATARREVHRRWTFFCEMAWKWTPGSQLSNLQSIVQFCREEDIEIPSHLILWIRVLTIAERGSA